VLFTGGNIAATPGDQTFSIRYGDFSYRIPAIAGQYDVRLHFVERYATAVGQRVFNYQVASLPPVTNYDIYADVGPNKETIKHYALTTTGTPIVISFTTVTGSARVAGIEVIPLNQPVIQAPAFAPLPLPIATQSSTAYPQATADKAVDGNTDGVFTDNSVTHTNSEAQPWWQVDLGASIPISSIAVWGRTDCCSSRLGDYWIFVSDMPFVAADKPASLQTRAATWFSHQTTAPNPFVLLTPSVQGRYLRVQLTGTDILSLAEVQVNKPPPSLTSSAVQSMIDASQAKWPVVTAVPQGTTGTALTTTQVQSMITTAMASAKPATAPLTVSDVNALIQTALNTRLGVFDPALSPALVFQIPTGGPTYTITLPPKSGQIDPSVIR